MKKIALMDAAAALDSWSSLEYVNYVFDRVGRD
jgi:hypothetical protein